MAKIDWTQYIIPQVYPNTQPNGKVGDASFDTTDLITLPTWQDMAALGKRAAVRKVTDFAVMDGCSATGFNRENYGDFWLRSATSRDAVQTVDANGGRLVAIDITARTLGVLPMLALRLPDGMTKIEDLAQFGAQIKTVSGRGGAYVTIELGEYIKNRVDDKLAEKLEKLFNQGNLQGGLTCTGRLYTTNGNFSRDVLVYQDFHAKQNPEFSYQGQKYVRAIVSKTQNSTTRYRRDGTRVPPKGTAQWFYVEPLTFRITNAASVRAGKSRILQLQSEHVILGGLQFSLYDYVPSASMWQGSLLRAFLNSADSRTLDGNPEYQHDNFGWNFTGSGFLHQAFDLTREPTRTYTVPVGEIELPNYAFAGCVGMQKISIPAHVRRIGQKAFAHCPKTQVHFSAIHNLDLDGMAFWDTNFKFMYLAKNSDDVILSPYADATLAADYYAVPWNQKQLDKLCSNPNYRANFRQLMAWRAAQKIQFIPPDFTMELFPSAEMKNYFVNGNHLRWGRMVRALGFDTIPQESKTDALNELMKIYYALGGFAPDQGASERAKNYVMQYVAVEPYPQATPEIIGNQIHARFSKINLQGPYNPTFAKFFMKYYHENPNFMQFDLGDRGEDMDYLCIAHNKFAQILHDYPNRVVNGNEERALLTPLFVAQRCTEVKYENVDQDNQTLADLVGRYGYNQDQFETMQEIFNRAKTTKDQAVIRADAARSHHGITFRVLNKDDPLGFVLGDITNCCQHICGVGGDCVVDGYLNPHAGFVVFETAPQRISDTPRILGQAYAWYDPVTQTVCYDNIEIPTKVIDELEKGDKSGAELGMQNLLDAVIQAGETIMATMNQRGVAVRRVTVGRGHNDMYRALEKRFGEPETNPQAKHRDYCGYTDAGTAQYVICTGKHRTCSINPTQLVLKNSARGHDLIDPMDRMR